MNTALEKKDHLATAAARLPILPYLRDGTGYITSREKCTLTIEIRAYLQQRNNWTDHIFDSINWTAYRAAISVRNLGDQTQP
jgi:hypothetical protein